MKRAARAFVRAGGQRGAALLLAMLILSLVTTLAADPGFDPLPWGEGIDNFVARRLEGKGVACAASVECIRHILQLRRHEVPVVEHLLQRAGDASGVVRGGEVAGDDDELTVA